MPFYAMVVVVEHALHDPDDAHAAIASPHGSHDPVFVGEPWEVQPVNADGEFKGVLRTGHSEPAFDTLHAFDQHPER